MKSLIVILAIISSINLLAQSGGTAMTRAIKNESLYSTELPAGHGLEAAMRSDTLDIDTNQVKFIRIGASGKALSVASLGKKDSVAVPLFVLQVTDTVKVEKLLYRTRKGKVFERPGYRILKHSVATVNGRDYQPLAAPEVIGALNSKKRRVTPVLSQ